MKLSQLALTLVLVAGGIFVYDAFVVREAPEPGPAPLREEPAPPTEAEPAPFPILEGRGDDIWRADIERRIEELEHSAPTTAGTTRAGESPTPGLPAAEDGDPDESETTEGEDAPRSRRFTPRDVATFRALLETVERQRREEKTRRQMLDGLKKIGVELDPTQADQVVDLTLKLYRGFQAKTRSIPKDEQGRDQRLAVFNELKRDYEDELYGMIPPGEADRIMEAINARAQQQPKRSR